MQLNDEHHEWSLHVHLSGFMAWDITRIAAEMKKNNCGQHPRYHKQIT